MKRFSRFVSRMFRCELTRWILTLLALYAVTAAWLDYIARH